MKTKKFSIDLQFFGGEPEEIAEAKEPAAVIPEISEEADESEEEALSDDWLEQVKNITETADRKHRARLEREAEEMRCTFPDFDLDRELDNPVFAQITSLDIGVDAAYYAVHHKEIVEAARREAAQKTAEKIAGAIRSGSRRPSESGGSSQAPSVSAFDYAKASKTQREAFKKDLLARMARGEKVYPTR